MGFEHGSVKPKVTSGVKLYRVEITQDEAILGETTADAPQRRRETAARPALRSVTPEEVNQAISGLRLAAMQNQVCEQRLGFLRGRLGQTLVAIADIQRAQNA
jgi:hypothetical protein